MFDLVYKFFCRFQSEIYELIDAIHYDDASVDRTSDYYYNPNYGTLTHSDGYYTLSMNGVANYVNIKSAIGNNVKGTTFNFEVDVVLNGASVRTRVYEGTTPIASSPYTASDGTITLENVTVPSDSTNNISIRLERRYNNDGDSIKFKNYTIYPV